MEIKVKDLTTEELFFIVEGFNSYSNYWCDLLDWDEAKYNEVRENIPEDERTFEGVLTALLESGSYLSITVEDEVHKVYKKDIIAGVQKAIEEYELSSNMDTWDALSCDIIMQCAIFNELIYG